MSNPSPNDLPLPARMMQMITGHWVSQVVGALARLAIADAVNAGDTTSAAVAARCRTHPGATYRLLRTAAGLGLFTEQPRDTFTLTPLGHTLCTDAPGSMREWAMAETDEGHWLPWGHLSEAVRTGEHRTRETLGQEIFEWYASHPADGAIFSRAMGNLAKLAAAEVAQACDFSSARTIADIGGAHGVLLETVLQKYPQPSGIIFDLPETAERARQTLKASGLAARVEAVGGDFFVDVPPADVYLLKQVLHDWNDEQGKTILSLCAKRMVRPGRICIVEMIVPDDNTPSFASMMDINMLVMLPGRERTLAEYRALLAASGLTFERVISTHSPFQIIEASAR